MAELQNINILNLDIVIGWFRGFRFRIAELEQELKEEREACDRCMYNDETLWGDGD